MKSIAIAIVYAAVFVAALAVPTYLKSFFLASYVTVLMGSVAFPLWSGEASALRRTGLYTGLGYATIILVAIALYFEYLFGLFDQGSTVAIVAGSWILFSLIFSMGSLASVWRLSSRLSDQGLQGLRSQDPGVPWVQHFAVEYCTLRWYRHGSTLLLSIVVCLIYLYGWFLLGIVFLIYSVGLLAVFGLLLATVSKRLLLPFGQSEVLKQLESGH